MEIHTCIAELLSQHDCVIVPGFGGFIGSYIPAQIHPVYHTFQPPAKKILFNINLRQNDGLLIAYVSRTQGISFQEASENVNRFAEEIHHTLGSRKYLLLSHIGKLYLGKEGNVQFEQDLRTNHLADSFGLTPFFSSPVATERILPDRSHRIGPKQDTMDLVNRALPRPLKWAAILAIPISLTVMLSLAGYDSLTTGSWNTANLLSSLSPFSKPEQFHQPAPASTPLFIPPDEETIPENIQQHTVTHPVHGPVTEPTDQQASTRQPVAVTPEQPTGTFAVIVGAFSIENNAKRLVRQLEQKGIRAQIFDRSPGGLFRVSAGVFTSPDEAANHLRSMKSTGFPGAWLLTK